MAWVDGETTLQQFPEAFEKILNDNGWETFAKYRATDMSFKQSSSTVKRRYADVRLFRSIGTDGQIRNFGFVHGYGYDSKAGETDGDFISQSSILGQLGVGDGITTTFQILVYPVIAGQSYVYKNGQLVAEDQYQIDTLTGKITFDTAPAEGDKLTISYIPDPSAPLPVRRMYFFAFEDVRAEKLVKSGDPMSLLPDGDGTRKDFPIPVMGTIKPGTLKVFNNLVEVPIDLYDFDAQTNTIIYKDTSLLPVAGAEMTAEFTLVLSGTLEGTAQNFGDIEVKSFNPETPESLMGAAYSALNYLYPSLPTAMSVTPVDNYNRGWQRDSSIYYWGNITKDRIALHFRPDPSAGPENTYFAPLYIGRLTTIAGTPPRKNHVIMSGCRDKDEIKWGTNKKLGPFVVDYGPNTSNGNSSVQLQQSIGGTYYQMHYLAFITHDKSMDSGEARFNPSVYSGKYHIAPMYVVHPNDGYVGRLDECYAIHPKNIYQLDELEVNETSNQEHIGTGDGVTKVFHLAHTPVQSGTGQLKILVDCVLKTVNTDYTIDFVNKTVTFQTAPEQGAEILATYDYRQIYRFTLADTPITPTQLAAISPYVPIGMGVLKENVV